MTWHRQTNFHNSRNYEVEAQRGGVVSHARITLAWLIDAAARQFPKVSKPKPAQASDAIMVQIGDGRGFTVLGSAISHHAVHESAMTCPFPELDDTATRLRSGQRRGRALRNQARSAPIADPSARSSER